MSQQISQKWAYSLNGDLETIFFWNCLLLSSNWLTKRFCSFLTANTTILLDWYDGFHPTRRRGQKRVTRFRFPLFGFVPEIGSGEISVFYYTTDGGGGQNGRACKNGNHFGLKKREELESLKPQKIEKILHAISGQIITFAIALSPAQISASFNIDMESGS